MRTMKSGRYAAAWRLHGKHDPEHLPALIRRLGWGRRTAMQDNRNALLTLIEVIANDIAALRRLIAAGDLVAIKE
jgi:hypothetical protein